MASKLDEKKKLFPALYIKHKRNGAKAAFELGTYRDLTTARYAARKLLKDPEVQAEIAVLTEEWKARLGVTTERILEELRDIAFARISDYVEWDDQTATLKPSTSIGKRKKRAIAEVRNTFIDGQGETRIKFHSKEKALELLGKHLGLFNEKGEVEHKGEIRVIVEEYSKK